MYISFEDILLLGLFVVMLLVLKQILSTACTEFIFMAQYCPWSIAIYGFRLCAEVLRQQQHQTAF